MRFARKLILSLPLLVISLPLVYACNQDTSYEYLKVLNSEDYIFKAEEEGEKDLVVQFEEAMLKEGRKVKVVYDTFDTMENMLNTLKTGKTTYDLICCSDYIVQKLNSLNLIEEIDLNQIPQYRDNVSPFIKNEFSTIDMGKGKNMNDFAVGYMWGTLGLIYNPEFSLLKNRGVSANQVKSDIQDWKVLWNNKYNKVASIKDSMRDTYAVGILKTYSDEFMSLHSKYNEGKIALEEYNTKINEIFNRGGESDSDAIKHINEVKRSLLSLRNNIFGFEVDGGKEDIVTKKIGIDLAWSGDAVYSIKKAMNKEETSNPFNLYYSIPKQGSNLWFDAWVMEKGCKKDLSYKFLDFISTPKNAIQNMDYIGYTSTISGDEIFEDYFKEQYEVKKGEPSVPYNVSYFFSDNPLSEDYIINVSDVDYEGRMHAQFPRYDEVPRLMIMKDYGDRNDDILKMWQEVKHEALPTWAIVLFVIEVVLIGGGISALIIIKVKNKKQRKSRRLANAK